METGALQAVVEITASIVLKHGGLKDARVMLVDSTGFQVMDASAYYMDRAQRKADFAKLHVVMDLDTRVIVVATPTDRYVHDVQPMRKYFVKRLRKIARMLGFRIKAVSADSAYAAEDVYRAIKRELKAAATIKPKKTRGIPRHGEIGKAWRMRNLPWFKSYADKRWILEAMFKVFKRLFTPQVKAKTPEERGKELIAKVIVWNTLIMAKQALGTNILAIGI